MASALTVAEVRRYVAASIDTALAASGWQESPVPYDVFGSLESDNLGHRSYAVGCPSSAPYKEDRQRPARMPAETTVGIRWSYNLAALGQVDSYDAALAAEHSILTAIMAAHRGAGVHLVLVGASRQVDPDGWALGAISLRAHHLIDLT